MNSWVQVMHDGSAFVVRTYLESTRVSEVITSDASLALQELTTRLGLLKGLARGKVFTSISHR